jgi:hypothetical protein
MVSVKKVLGVSGAPWGSVFVDRERANRAITLGWGAVALKGPEEARPSGVRPEALVNIPGLP